MEVRNITKAVTFKKNFTKTYSYFFCDSAF